MNATGTAEWTGSWRTGQGSISTTSPAVEHAPYSYTSRFIDEHGIAPEELLAAAHASCFNQALANNLDQTHVTADFITTRVDVDYEITAAGLPTINGSHITVSARIPGITEETFLERVERSAHGCSISRVLSCKITTSATLLTD